MTTIISNDEICYAKLYKLIQDLALGLVYRGR